MKDQPVSQLITDMKAGDEDATQKLWNAYFQRIAAVARRKLGAEPRREADEEDVVVSVFDSCLRRAREGTFSRLEDRNDFWQILVLITNRKVCNLKKRRVRQKRGGGRVRGDSVFIGMNESASIEDVISEEPTPDMAVMMIEEVEKFLDGLSDPTLQQIAVWKLEGYTNKEIAEMMDCAERTVVRKLNRIRDIAQWGTVE